MADVTLNSHTYSADGTAPRDMLNGGHRQWFIPCLADWLVESGNVNTAKSGAEAARDAAQNYAAALSGISATSITIGTGSKSLTASTGKQWQVGQYVYVANTPAPTNYMSGQVTAYNAATGALTVNVTGTGGSGTFAAWTITIGGAQGATGSINSLSTDTKTAAYTMVTGDKGKMLQVSGTFTLAFQAVATLGAGWWAWIYNVGTGAVTLDPNASQLIDGLTSYPMYPGEARLVWCTGSALQSLVVRPFRHVYTASGTFIEPPGYAQIALRGWGAGGSGARSGSATAVLGGGGGGCFDHQTTPTPGTSRTVTIGAGGAAVTGAADGNAGGDTTYGALFTWIGGRGGVTGSTLLGAHSIVMTLDGFPIAGAYRGATGATEGASVWGGGGSATTSNRGKSSVYGGGGGGAGSSSADGRTAGESLYGGAGGAGGDSTNGAAGSAPGGGGGGTRTGTSSGAGARGQLEIWGVC